MVDSHHGGGNTTGCWNGDGVRATEDDSRARLRWGVGARRGAGCDTGMVVEDDAEEDRRDRGGPAVGDDLE